jgi:hypothetical protein
MSKHLDDLTSSPKLCTNEDTTPSLGDIDITEDTIEVVAKNIVMLACPKAGVLPVMGVGLVLSPILTQAPGMANQFLIVSNYTVLKNICILFHITTTSNLLF